MGVIIHVQYYVPVTFISQWDCDSSRSPHHSKPDSGFFQVRGQSFLCARIGSSIDQGFFDLEGGLFHACSTPRHNLFLSLVCETKRVS
jgi:hypothetical protein